jgi:hypothetical protein
LLQAAHAVDDTTIAKVTVQVSAARSRLQHGWAILSFRPILMLDDRSFDHIPPFLRSDAGP